jgi:hypothetical protein
MSARGWFPAVHAPLGEGGTCGGIIVVLSRIAAESSMSRRLAIAILVLSTSACTWVEPDAGGRSIRVAYDDNAVAGCIDLRRTVTVSVKADLLGIERNAIKVRDELESLARNEASKFPEADTIRARDEPANGEQTFAVYDCR